MIEGGGDGEGAGDGRKVSDEIGIMNYTRSLRFDDLSPATRVLWAKSGDLVGQSLLAHMLDVAAVTEELLNSGLGRPCFSCPAAGHRSMAGAAGWSA